MNFNQLLELFDLGKELSKQESSQLESALKSDSCDMVSRMKLLGYYRAHPDASGYIRHLGWIIDNRINDEEILHFAVYNRFREADVAVYDNLKSHWLKYLEPDTIKPVAILNAAEFFILNDDFEIAFACVQKLETCDLEENDFLSMATLYERLGNLARRERDDPFVAGLLRKAIDWCEKAVMSDDRTCAASTQLVALLFVASRFAQLKDVATEVLKRADRSDPSDVYTIHMVNITLGKVALVDGDLPTAVRHLAASVELPSSPSLLSATGPDLTLAEALLEKGEKVPVLSFLSKCEGLTLSDNSKRLLQSWSEAIADGRNPDSSR
jgi:tetratricopeptide (TPR) repeat protein